MSLFTEELTKAMPAAVARRIQATSRTVMVHHRDLEATQAEDGMK